MFTCEEIQARVANIKAAIVEYENASLQLATDQIQSYSFNTGQTIQSVTKFNVDTLDKAIDAMHNRLAVLYNRYPACTGSGSGAVIVRPAW